MDFMFMSLSDSLFAVVEVVVVVVVVVTVVVVAEIGLRDVDFLTVVFVVEWAGDKPPTLPLLALPSAAIDSVSSTGDAPTIPL
mmetsp:Transcript_16737/g.30332  ORF Transcript_16737/g.30332 Transcript_16737/m.30332 type:complete len:83 (+) Transcript_16737:41-289(+)